MAGCGSIKRATDMQAGPIQDVRVEHGRGDILYLVRYRRNRVLM